MLWRRSQRAAKPQNVRVSAKSGFALGWIDGTNRCTRCRSAAGQEGVVNHIATCKQAEESMREACSSSSGRQLMGWLLSNHCLLSNGAIWNVITHIARDGTIGKGQLVRIRLHPRRFGKLDFEVERLSAHFAFVPGALVHSFEDSEGHRQTISSDIAFNADGEIRHCGGWTTTFDKTGGDWCFAVLGADGPRLKTRGPYSGNWIVDGVRVIGDRCDITPREMDFSEAIDHWRRLDEAGSFEE